MALLILLLPPAFAALTRSLVTGFAVGALVTVVTIPLIVLAPESEPPSSHLVEYSALFAAIALIGLMGSRVKRARVGLLQANRRLDLMSQNADTLIHATNLQDALSAILPRLAAALELELVAVHHFSSGRTFCCPDSSSTRDQAHALMPPPGAPGGLCCQLGAYAFGVAAAGQSTGALLAKPRSGELDQEALNVLQFAAHQLGESLAQEAWLETQQAQAAAFANQVLDAQEVERRKLARELHDQTAQELTALIRQLDEVSTMDDNRRSELISIREMARESLAGVRRIAQDLRPTLLDDLGLCPALEQLATDITRRGKLAVELTASCSNVRLDAATELAVFRIAQEALNNAEKHSSGGNVWVSLNCLISNVTVSVSDEGPGFDFESVFANSLFSGQLGLVGMFERARLAGLSLSVDTQPGTGTTVRIATLGGIDAPAKGDGLNCEPLFAGSASDGAVMITFFDEQ